MTGRLLAKAMAAALRQIKKGRNAPKAGRQSMKRLARSGDATSSIEAMGRIQSFEPIARKYQVSYHTERDRGTKPPTITIYFKSKQADAMTTAFSEYTKKTLNRAADKPSVLAQLRKFKELTKNTVIDRVKNKDRGGHAL